MGPPVGLGPELGARQTATSHVSDFLMTGSEPADELHIHPTPQHLVEAPFGYKSVKGAFRGLRRISSR